MSVSRPAPLAFDSEIGEQKRADAPEYPALGYQAVRVPAMCVWIQALNVSDRALSRSPRPSARQILSTCSLPHTEARRKRQVSLHCPIVALCSLGHHQVRTMLSSCTSNRGPRFHFGWASGCAMQQYSLQEPSPLRLRFTTTRSITASAAV
jgi:hypothetical protein